MTTWARLTSLPRSRSVVVSAGPAGEYPARRRTTRAGRTEWFSPAVDPDPAFVLLRPRSLRPHHCPGPPGSASGGRSRPACSWWRPSPGSASASPGASVPPVSPAVAAAVAPMTADVHGAHTGHRPHHELAPVRPGSRAGRRPRSSTGRRARATPGLSQAVRTALHDAGLPGGRLHEEVFAFSDGTVSSVTTGRRPAPTRRCRPSQPVHSKHRTGAHPPRRPSSAVTS